MTTVRESISVEVLKVALITLKKMKKLVKSTSKGVNKPFTLYRSEYDFKQEISFDDLFNDISKMVIVKKYPSLNPELFFLEFKQYEHFLTSCFYNSVNTKEILSYSGIVLRKEITYFHHLIDNILIDIGKKDHDFSIYAEKMLYTDSVFA